MGRLLKFDDFANGKKPNAPISNESVNSNFVPKHKEQPIMQNRQTVEDSMNALVWKGVLESSYFTQVEKLGIYHMMKRAGVNNQSMNESILTRMREILPKLKEDGTEVKEEIIDKLEKVMKSAGAFSKYLADLILKAWDRALGFYKTKLDPAKADVFARIKLLRRSGKDFNDISTELANVKEIVMFWLKQFPSTVSKSLLQNYSKAIMKESLEVSADIHTSLMKFSPNRLNEQNDALWSFMDEITDQLRGQEPFKTISSVRSFDGVDSDKFADAFVKYTANAGGPAVKTFNMLPFIMDEVVKHKNSSLPGDMQDQIIKSEGVLKFLPMNKEILIIIEALAMTVVSMETMLKMKEDNESVYKK